MRRAASVSGAVLLSSAAALGLAFPSAARAEGIADALARAYSGNPDLNAQRANVRVQDENLPRTLSGYRPRVTLTGDVGYQNYNFKTRPSNDFTNVVNAPRGYGVNVTQTVFNGNRVSNSVTQAESTVLAARETMRNAEQTVLLNGATAYMNVLRDTAILGLRKNNITVLEEQLRQTRDRFQVGEVTRTDVAQAESSLATARSDFFTAQSNLATSIANYRQVIGVEPKRLDPARPLDNLLPPRLDDAIASSVREHPAIQAAFHNVDAAAIAVKIVEGELFPTLSVTGSVGQRFDALNLAGSQTVTASVVGSLSVPIYEGGEVYARARQAKETLGQTRIQADSQRDAVRSQVVTSWGQLESSKAVTRSAQAAVSAAEIALNGVREEAKVGQRTTLDVLNAQQTLLNARVSLVTAQRDRVVASYAVLSASGRLSAVILGLKIVRYDPTIHYDQVRDKWIGLRTPDGR